MHKWRRTILFLFLLLTISGHTTAASLGSLFGGGGDKVKMQDLGGLLKSAKDAFGEVKPEEEQAIGREAAAVLLGAVPLVKDKALQRYVNQVGYWIALQSERPDLHWRFAILDSEDINAFAAPGGFVFITKGLLLSMTTEAELAGVLAHEIVHVVAKHHLQAVQKGARLNLAAGLAATQAGSVDRDQLDKISAGFKEIYSRGLDKNDEFEADRKGVILATRAGYDPYGLAATLQTLGAMNPADGSLALLFKTHPSPGQRLEQMEGLFAPLESYAQQPAIKDRFQREIAAAKKRNALAAYGQRLQMAICRQLAMD